jgi:sugar/nucleoside kinase (ribokinase family)
MKHLQVVALCNALVDILVEVDEATLSSLNLRRGVMHLVDSATQKSLLQKVAGFPKSIELGGSSLNAIRALAAMGHKTAFAGMVGQDEFGSEIKTRLSALRIDAQLGEMEEATGTCLIFVTPDGERTMNTCLGASRLYGEKLVPHDIIEKSSIFHFCGYQWDTSEQVKAIKDAISTAQRHDTLISFDLADPFVVEKHREDFIKVIEDHADIVFANKEEARLLFGKTAEGTADEIAKRGAIAVVKLGPEGAIIKQGETTYRVKAVPTKVVDTTAAGDMFAAGFLHGYLKRRDLNRCGELASMLASDVISRVGATVSDHMLASVARG